MESLVGDNTDPQEEIKTWSCPEYPLDHISFSEGLLLASGYRHIQGSQRDGCFNLLDIDMNILVKKKVEYGVLESRFLRDSPNFKNNNTHNSDAVFSVCSDRKLRCSFITKESMTIVWESEDIHPSFDSNMDVIGVGMDLCVSPRSEGNQFSIFVAGTDSVGNVLWLNLVIWEGQVTVKESKRWVAHEGIETWTVAIDPFNPLRVATGADDCSLKIWNLFNICEAVSVNTRFHEAGVTVCRFDRSIKDLLYTGSYDTHIRAFRLDMGILSRASMILEYACEGGIWRVEQTDDDELYVALSYDGACIFSKNGDVTRINIRELKSYNGHNSMIYGICKISNNANTKSTATCSFYDKSIHIW